VNPLLIAYDGTPRVVEVAATLVAGYSAVLLVSTRDGDAARADDLARRGAVLAASLGIKAVPCSRAGDGPPWEVIAQVVRETQAWMVVGGGCEVAPLIGHVACPVLVVP
jgi:nucleotide-binding universal stress UspA family protein